jgi:uncharacterized protein YxjI
MINKINPAFPLTIKFSFWLGFEMKVADDSGNLLMFMRQKMFRLREHIEVFADENSKEKLYDIKTNKILDFSANYNIQSVDGKALGFLRRKGWSSIWSANYDICDADGEVLYKIKEANPLIKVLDALFSEVPILGIFSGYVFNPSYKLLDLQREEIYNLKKKPSFLSRIFTISKNTDNTEHLELILLSYMMVLILERHRG